MQHFQPTSIYIDKQVYDKPLTQRVLNYFPNIPYVLIDNALALKKPDPITYSKRKLLITKFKGEVLKKCQGAGDYVCCHYYTISFGSNCHMECSYCFLQDYLKNNPIMTLYANVDEILDELQIKLNEKPDDIFRIGTGELTDSLALDGITGLSKSLVTFAASQKNMVLELKTKSNQIQNLLDLNHNKKTIVSWSINPQTFIDLEEHKTSSLNQRIEAARTIADKGYPVGFHLDPLLYLDNWKHEYKNMVDQLKNNFDSPEIAWISLGSLRFTPGLKEIAIKRFKTSKIFYNELYPSQDGKVRYFRELRTEIYSYVKNLIDTAFDKTSNYLCMETSKVWKDVYKEVPQTINHLENRLSQQFRV